MKILQICYKPPFPATDGGAMGMNSMTRGLLNMGHKVKVLSFHSKKHPCKLENLPQEYKDETNFETVLSIWTSNHYLHLQLGLPEKAITLSDSSINR